MELNGKVAVVAGASGGIGKHISKALSKEGVHVFLIGRREGVLEALKRDIDENGGKANVYSADITDEDSVKELSRFLEKEVGKVDLLINAAGIGIYKNFSDVGYDDWRRQMAINVDAVFLMTQKLLPMLLISDDSYVISLGSGMGKIALAGRSPYCTSKFALRGLMQALSKEYKKSNLKFVHIVLGSVMTSFGPLTLEEKLQKQEKGKVYLDPDWLAQHIIKSLKNDTLKAETPIYPKHYFEESKDGKT